MDATSLVAELRADVRAAREELRLAQAEITERRQKAPVAKALLALEHWRWWHRWLPPQDC
jgi:hypothetical protein